MIAKVKDIKFNVEMGRYRVTKLFVTNDKGEDKDYTIFTNAKYHNVVSQLRPGDNVDIKMVKNGKYWNVDDVTVVEAPKAAPASSGGGSYKRYEENPNKDVAIARAVALKAGVDLYCAMIAGGLTKKTLKPDAAVAEVFAITKKFENYTTLSEDIEALSTDSSSIKADADEYDESPFPE